MPEATTRTLAQLPGPRGVPWFGNALQLEPLRMHQVLEGWAAIHGPLFAIKVMRQRWLIVADPALIQQVFRERPENYGRFAPIAPVFAEMGFAGLIPAEGEVWRRQRRIWIAALNATQVKTFLPQLADTTARLLRRWSRSAAAGEAVDVKADLMHYTVDVSTRFALGHDPNTLEHDGDVIQNYLKSVFPAAGRRTNAAFPYWRYFRLPVDRRLDRDLTELRARIGALITAAHQRLARSPALAQRPTNLIEGLLSARDEDGTGLTDNEVYSNVLTALLAGEDTTASTLAWMMHFLAGHPEVQQRLQQEADTLLDGSAVWTDPGQAEAMRYADAVMSETLRLKPPAPAMGHTTVRDVELGGVRLPAGTHVFTLLRPAAAQAQQYEDPAQFRPERWLAQAPRAYIQRVPTPFGGGPRICPGHNFAAWEMKSVAAMLARNFVLEPAPGPGPIGELLSFAMEPVNLRVRLRPRG